MTNNEWFNNVVDSIEERSNKILKSKTQDYNSEADPLSLFKGVANAAKALNIDVHTPEGVSAFMTVLKIYRFTNLLNSGKQPNHEKIDDTLLDMINYTKLIMLNHIDTITSTVVYEE